MNSSTSPKDLMNVPRRTKDPASASAAANSESTSSTAKSTTPKPKAKPKKAVHTKAVAKVEPPDEFAVLRMTLFSLFTIGVVVGLLFAWTGYSHKYAQVTEGWHLGQSKLIEVTVVKEDKGRLACASDISMEGIHCGYHLDGKPFESHSQDDSQVVSPFNTVKNELFLGAGLWTSLAVHGPVPNERFTAACNYKIWVWSSRSGCVGKPIHRLNRSSRA